MDDYIDHYAILELLSDKKPNDLDAHRNVLNLLNSYKILMDEKLNSSSKRHRKTNVDEREQATHSAFSVAKAARDMEEYIRRIDGQLIARIKCDAASAATSRAPPAASATPPILNKGGAKQAPASNHCPCGHYQGGGHCLDREVSCNFDAARFEALENCIQMNEMNRTMIGKNLCKYRFSRDKQSKGSGFVALTTLMMQQWP
ncbi:hypothetical protein AgCh_005555 [Apium graveolens]